MPSPTSSTRALIRWCGSGGLVALLASGAGGCGAAVDDAALDGTAAADTTTSDIGIDAANRRMADTGATGDTPTRADSAACQRDDQCPAAADGCELPRCQANGTCSVIQLCECQFTPDCAALEDGDLCNGVLFCDSTATPRRCRIKPSSVVTCDPSSDTFCRASTCQPDTGFCATVPRHEGGACDDGSPCTADTLCTAGECAGGVGICDCEHDTDCAAYNSPDVCTGVHFCDKTGGIATCRLNPASVVHCDTTGDTACATTACNPTSGACALAAQPTGTACDDGNACTAGDRCVAGACEPGPTDVCVCKSNKDCASQEDGDACNGTLYCDVSATQPTCKLNRPP